jgi:hypothetical protein
MKIKRREPEVQLCGDPNKIEVYNFIYKKQTFLNPPVLSCNAHVL